jgi:hypothetical protein
MVLISSMNYNIKLVITLENRRQADQYINFEIEISLEQEKILCY